MLFISLIMVLIFLLVLACMQTEFQLVKGETSIRCVERERVALLEFKEGLTDEYGHFSSWGSAEGKKECCKWWGVRCSNTTGHVVALQIEPVLLPSFRGKMSPSLIELRHLNVLDLSGFDFERIRIPKFIGSMKSLKRLRLDYCFFSGPIPLELGNLSNLVTLDLNSNMLTSIPLALGKLTNLVTLDLYGNDLNSIPLELGNLTNLVTLDLSYNKLTSIPLAQFSHLEILDLSHNSLQGTIREAHMMNLTKLKELYLSYNSLAFSMSPDWVPPFHLERLNLASCKSGPSFPTWLQSQKDLVELDLTNNDISDEVPTWFWEFPHKVEYLNISGNKMSGTIPDLSSHLVEVIDASSNKFLSPLPSLHPATVAIFLSQNMFSGSDVSSFICTFTNNDNLYLVDLSNNQLTGTLPTCWENMTGLEFLFLTNNNFSGEIPYTLGSLTNLISLHLRDNNLVGELPSSLSNCQYLQMMDIGGNKLTGNIPSWLDGRNYIRMEYLSLSNNRFYGDIPIGICKLNQLRILDLSGNNLSGKIPQCFSNFSLSDSVSVFYVFSSRSMRLYIEYASLQWKGRESEYRKTLYLLTLIDLSRNKLVGSIPKSLFSLKALISLNLSRNYLTGHIDMDIGKMEKLECLDLSHNLLSGEIPIGLANLSFLEALDLSNNNLSGKIPSGTQLQSFTASTYAGNKNLCGLPLKLCLDVGHGASVNDKGEDIEEKDGGIFSLSFMQEFGISMAFGFIAGFWGFVASLLLKKSWRRAYFNCLAGYSCVW